MLLIAGLGNPGPRYAGNRHNIGFMALDEIHRDPSFSPWSQKFKGEISEGRIGSEKVLLLKPQTFMNASGESVAAAAGFYKIDPARVIVLHDELDLPPGKVRVKTGGGHGGHNGLRSIDAHLGRDYRRVRLGIGHPGAKVDQEWLRPLLEDVARNATLLASGDDAGFMNRLSGPGVGAGEKKQGKPPTDDASGPKAKPKGASHIRQARGAAPQRIPTSGPMADMLKRIFGKD